MSISTTITTSVVDLIREQQDLEAMLERNDPCGHTPLGVLKDACRQCWRHNRCDELDRAIGRLLDNGRVG